MDTAACDSLDWTFWTPCFVTIRCPPKRVNSKSNLVVDGLDGKAHYVALGAKVELAQYPVGSVVEVRGSVELRTADKTIAALAVEGIYRTDHHLVLARTQTRSNLDPLELVTAHVRRLEALRRASLVERLSDGVWRVPADLPERGRQYDAQRLGGVAVELRSHLSIAQQTRAMGATWLDQQLVSGVSDIGDSGFGGEVREALQERGEFLVEKELAQRREQRLVLNRNLLATLRNREIEKVAQSIAAETGLIHRPVVDGERVELVPKKWTLKKEFFNLFFRTIQWPKAAKGNTRRRLGKMRLGKSSRPVYRCRRLRAALICQFKRWRIG
jgi:hypothetical protein